MFFSSSLLFKFHHPFLPTTDYFSLALVPVLKWLPALGRWWWSILSLLLSCVDENQTVCDSFSGIWSNWRIDRIRCTLCKYHSRVRRSSYHAILGRLIKFDGWIDYWWRSSFLFSLMYHAKVKYWNVMRAHYTISKKFPSELCCRCHWYRCLVDHRQIRENHHDWWRMFFWWIDSARIA